MIGLTVTADKDGNPIDGNGQKLSQSAYQPSEEVKKLFARVQTDYQIAYTLQHRAFQEFDDKSLLERASADQQTFGAYVGAQFLPVHKRWRWKGRKNTARNKLIGILAHMIAGILMPTVFAKNDEQEEDKITARVMQILIEDHLKGANYEMKFLYMVLSALVNPAVFVEVEYVEAMQRIKKQVSDGSYKIVEAVDDLLSGLNLNVIPIDEIMLADFYTNDLQRQPYIIRIRRIAWDEARKIYGENANFKYVEAGKTRVVLTGNENQTLYDIEWTEADRNYVQELTIRYRPEDLEAVYVGGVFMGNENDIYNSNPLSHRRFALVNDEWASVPVYPFAKSFFEPIDPSGRFAYGKSAAFKAFWEDATQNKMHQLLIDGTYLDVFKPMFLSGVTKADSTVIAPGATIGMPKDATATPYMLGPNLPAAMTALNKQEQDMSESTMDKLMMGQLGGKQTAYAVSAAMTNAKIMLGLFGLMTGDLVRQVGDLTVDCIITNTTVGELDATIPEALGMKYHTLLAKGKDHGKQITHKIVFSDRNIGRDLSADEVKRREFELYRKAGGDGSDQRIWEVNPYNFARMRYTLEVDADKMIMRSIGGDKTKKAEAFAMLSDPRVLPYTDPKAVVDYFVIEEFSDGDPDQFKAKGDVNQMMQGVMGGAPGGEPPAPNNTGGGAEVGAQKNQQIKPMAPMV